MTQSYTCEQKCAYLIYISNTQIKRDHKFQTNEKKGELGFGKRLDKGDLKVSEN